MRICGTEIKAKRRSIFVVCDTATLHQSADETTSSTSISNFDLRAFHIHGSIRNTLNWYKLRKYRCRKVLNFHMAEADMARILHEHLAVLFSRMQVLV